MSDPTTAASPFLRPEQQAPDPGVTTTRPFIEVPDPDFPGVNPNSLVVPEEVNRQRFLAQMINLTPDREYEVGRQNMASIVSALYPDISFDEVYKNPFPVIAQLTGYDFRNGGDPTDIATMLKEKMNGIGANFELAQVDANIGDLEWEYSQAGTDAARQNIQARIDELKKKRDFMPFDKWAAAGTQGGVIDQVLGIGDASLKFSTDFVATLGHDVLKPLSTAFDYSDVKRIGEVSEVPLGTSDDPLSWAMKPRQVVNESGQVETVVARPMAAFFLWGTKNVPLVGTGYARMAGQSAAEMRDAGVDPEVARHLSSFVGMSGSAANLIAGSTVTSMIARGLSESGARHVIESATFQGVKKYLMNGTPLGILSRTGLVKLETTGGGRLLKASASGVSAAAKETLGVAIVNAGSVAANDIAFNVSIELTNGIIQEEGRKEAAAAGIKDKDKIDQYVAANAPRLAAKYKDIIKDFGDTFTQTLVGMLPMTAALGAAGRMAGGSRPKGITADLTKQIDDSVVQETAIARQALSPETIAAKREFLRRADETGVAPNIQTGYIKVSTMGDRSGPGIRVTIGEAPVHDIGPITPRAAETAIRAREPAAQSEAFSEALRTGRVPEGLNPELGALAVRIRDQDTSPETMAVAQRYGIEQTGSQIAQVEFRQGKFATLSPEEMKNPAQAIAAYQKQGFDGVRAGSEAYIFDPENVIKTGDVARPSVMNLDPANSSVRLTSSSLKIESNGQMQELPVTREGGSVRVSGEVSPFVASRVAEELVADNEGVRLESDSPTLQRAIEAMNPDAPAIRARIGELETRLANLEESGGKRNQITAVRAQLQAVKDSLTTPKKEWAEARAYHKTKQEFETAREAVKIERASRGQSIEDQILKAAPNVTEAQAKTISELVGRMERRTGQRLLNAVLNDETIDANGVANQAERVIRLGKEANFDTVFHEVAHLARTLLTEGQQRTLIDELGLETADDGLTLTRAGEEKFADSARAYVQNKEGTDGLLGRIKHFINEIVRAIAPTLSDKAMATFDELFGEGDISRYDDSREMGGPGGMEGREGLTPESGMVSGGGPGALADLGDLGEIGVQAVADEAGTGAFPGELRQENVVPEHERIVRQALEDGKWVPDRVLEDYLDKSWALEEWNKRHPEETREMERFALTQDTPEAFADFVTSEFFDPEGIPESIRSLPEAEKRTALIDYWEKTNHPESVSPEAMAEWAKIQAAIKEAERPYSAEEAANAGRDSARISGDLSPAAKARTMAQLESRLRFQTNLEAQARVRIANLEQQVADQKGDKKALRNALSDARAEHKLTLQHLAADRRQRAAMEREAKVFMRPVSSKTVDVQTQRLLTDLKRQIDPKFHSASTTAGRKETAELLKSILDETAAGNEVHDKAFISQVQRAYDLASRKSLDEFTLDELRDFAATYRSAYDHGKAVIEAGRVAEESLIQNSIFNAVSNSTARPNKKIAKASEGFVTLDTVEDQFGGVVDKYFTALNLDMQRITDLLDGGRATYDGGFFKMIFEPVDRATDARIKIERTNLDDIHAALKSAGLGDSLSWAYKKREYNGQEITVSALIAVKNYWKNDQSRAALIGDGQRDGSGNRISESDYAAMMDLLTPEEHKFADWLMDWYNDPAHKDAIFGLQEELTNVPAKPVDDYSPMSRIGVKSVKPEEQLKYDMLGQSLPNMAKIPDNFLQERQQISDHHQTPLRLDAIGTWFSYQHHTAHYLSHAETMKRLTKIMNDPAFESFVVSRLGRVNLETMKRWSDRVKNPTMDASPLWYLGKARVRVQNISKAMLSSVKTYLRQAPTFLLYSGELKNPLNIIPAVVDFTSHWETTWKEISELSPQWANRIQDSLMREVINGTNDNVINKIGDAAMLPNSVIDAVATGWGWWAKYQEGLKEFADLGPEAAKTRAAKEADNAMNRTQQVSEAKDQSELFNKNEFMKFLTLFAGPQGKIFQTMTYDFPRRIKQNPARAAFTAAGLVAAGAMGWAFVNGRPPETEDDFKQVMADIFLSPVPIFGQSLSNSIYGYNRTGRITPLEFAAEFGDAIDAIKKGAEGKKTPDEMWQSFVRHAYGATALYTGLPLPQVTRIAGVMKDSLDGKEVDFRDLVGKDWGR